LRETCCGSGSAIGSAEGGNLFNIIRRKWGGREGGSFVYSSKSGIISPNSLLSTFLSLLLSKYLASPIYGERSKDRKVDNSEFGDIIPDLDEYTKEPPSLPPHLRLIILNKLPPSADPMALPEPQHVSLNHLYCTAIKDGMMVLGATQRYRQKYVTIVFYSVMAS
jgi:hypothetical protein